ncbi:MlaD family protein [Nocardia abscessus]|uniref:MlaD family protein n=1 Tax=Nocardia abscessus TaxID=120957 RepID=UPI00245863F6|nr:MlaD family protein [Nocardia abscessus]
MMSKRSLLLRLVIAAVLTAVIVTGILRVIDAPVTGDVETYTAEFTDVNGLRSGDDVRIYGIRVGKVVSVELDGTLARVRFTVARDRPVFDASTIAIRFQDLTGFRYLAVQQPEQPGPRRDPGDVIGIDRTVPAFDVTTLFNGLQPVLAQLSPEEINQFASNMLAVLEGDGTGLGPALDAIGELSRHVSDRQALITLVVSNLGQVSQHLGGKSANAMVLLANLTALFATLTDKLSGLVDFANVIPAVLSPLRNILKVLGISGLPDRDLDKVLRNAFPAPQQAVEVLGRLPGVLQTLASTVPVTGPDAAVSCSHGDAVAPAPLHILIAGQGVRLCNS